MGAVLGLTLARVTKDGKEINVKDVNKCHSHACLYKEVLERRLDPPPPPPSAICNPPCDHGTSSAPDYCACERGWEVC